MKLLMCPSDNDLAALMARVDEASQAVHAAILEMDSAAGELRRAVDSIAWERDKNRALFDGLRLVDNGGHSVRHDRLGVVS